MTIRALASQSPLEAFASIERFVSRRGELAFRLALHAAVPNAFRLDFLPLLRRNFLPEAASDSTVDSDLLLSELCQDLGGGYYQFDPTVRRILLENLIELYAYETKDRLDGVARFLLHYLDRLGRSTAGSQDRLLREYMETERWVALAFLQPHAAAEQLAEALQATEKLADAAARVRLGGLASVLSLPLGHQRNLLTYAAGVGALESGDYPRARELFGSFGDEPIKVGNVELSAPASILSEKLGGTKAPAAAREAEAATPRIARVFLSSVVDHLREMRAVAVDVLEELNMAAIAAEQWPAGTEVPLEAARERIASADAFVCLLGFRYGWIPHGESKSIVELEYDEAVDRGIPSLCFIVESGSELGRTLERDADPEERKRQEVFVKKVMSRAGVHIVHSIIDFRARLTMALEMLEPGRRPAAPAHRRLFISHAIDYADFAQRLQRDLSGLGYDVFVYRESVSGEDRQERILREIDRANAFLLLSTPGVLESRWVEYEWRRAIQSGDKTVVPLLYRGDLDLLPEPLRAVHALDFREDANYEARLAELDRILHQPPVPLGSVHGAPSLPPAFIARGEPLSRTKSALLRPVEGSQPPPPICLVGMPGVGKTVLAIALARDADVRRAFPDGIFWFAAQTAFDVQERLSEVFEVPLESSVTARRALERELRDKAYLLILDDVTQPDSLSDVPRTPRGRIVVTTRDPSLASALGAEMITIEAPTSAEALDMLAHASGIPVDELPEGIQKELDRLGHNPVAIEQLGRSLRETADSRVDSSERERTEERREQAGEQEVQSLLRDKKYEEALSRIVELEKTSELSARMRGLKGLILAQMGRTNEAQETLSALYEEGHRDPETLSYLALTWKRRYEQSGRRRDLVRARDLYAEAFEHAPDYYGVGINAASTSVFLGEFDAAAEYSRRVEKILESRETPADYWSLMTAAEAQLVQRRYQRASELYRDALAMDADSRSTHETVWQQVRRLVDALGTSAADRLLLSRPFEDAGLDRAETFPPLEAKSTSKKKRDTRKTKKKKKPSPKKKPSRQKSAKKKSPVDKASKQVKKKSTKKKARKLPKRKKATKSKKPKKKR